MAFNVGDFVGIRCEVKPGPFSEELLVTIQTVEGAISGFVKKTELRQKGESWEVRGKIKEIREKSIKVWIIGSFFTTNGIANIPYELAMAA